MRTFLLIRHGVNDWIDHRLAGRTPGLHLNTQGKKQAQDLAQHLQRLDIVEILTSPLERTRETAAPLAEKLNLPVQEDTSFLEVDYGNWTALTLAEVARDPLWRPWNEHRAQATIPGGESAQQIQDRAVERLNYLSRIPVPGLTLIFSHGDIIRSILCAACRLSLDHILSLTIDPASVSAVIWSPEERHVLFQNLPGAQIDNQSALASTVGQPANF